MKWFVFISFPLLALLNIYDAYSTRILLLNGAEEANIMMNWFMDIVGIIPAMIIAKSIFLCIFFVIGLLCFKEKCTNREQKFIFASYIISISIYSYVMLTRNYPMMKMLT